MVNIEYFIISYLGLKYMKKLLRRPDGLICKDICEIVYNYGMTIDFFDKNVNRGNLDFWSARNIYYNIRNNLPLSDRRIYKDELTDFHFYWLESDNQYICYRNDLKGLLVTLTWWGILPHLANYIALQCYRDPNKLEEHLKQFKAVYNSLDLGIQWGRQCEGRFNQLDSFCKHYDIQKKQLLERLANGWNLQDAVKVRKDFEDTLDTLDFKIYNFRNNNNKLYKDIYDLTKDLGLQINHFTENAVRLGFRRAIYLDNKTYKDFDDLYNLKFKWLPDKVSWIGTNQIWLDHLDNEYKSLEDMCKTYNIDVLQFIDMLNNGADRKYVFGGYKYQYLEFFGRPKYPIYFWENKKYYQIIETQWPLGLHSEFVPTWQVKIRQ